MISNYNYNPGNISRIKYIVIHYVGALGGAQENCAYYGGGNREASAHYFVGFAGEIGSAWKIGISPGIVGRAVTNIRNAETLIALGLRCVCERRMRASLGATDKDWYFEWATVQSAIELTKYLMQKYNIPADHVIRHYDVTGKICPNPYVYNTGTYTWDAFKKAISGQNGDILPATDKPWYRVRKTGKTPAVRSGHLKR